MRIVTGEEMAAIDRRAIEEIGIPAAALMENAGYWVARAAAEQLPAGVRGRRVVVLAGRGNNGGDGCVAARHLHNWGARVRVYRVGDRERRRKGEADGPGPAGSEEADLAARQFAILQRMGVDVVPVGPGELNRLKLNLAMADLVIDALLGTGFRGEPEGLFAAVIDAVNEVNAPVIAVDVPSGIDSARGPASRAVRASLTISFGLPKLGTLLPPSAGYCGRLRVVDIGFPRALLAEGAKAWWIQGSDVRDWLPPRPAQSHKGTFGHVLVVAGSRGMTGAGQLAVRGAHRAGAGLVTWALPASLQLALAPHAAECMTAALPEEEAGVLGPEATAPCLEMIARRQSLAIGPGLGRKPETLRFVADVLREARGPVVIDADALYALAELKGPPDGAEWILTPHPGEMARLLGSTTEEVLNDPVGAARTAAQRHRSVVVLKMSRTIVVAPDGRLWLNTTGNPALSAGGTGDVLAGAIAAFCAQGLPAWQAAAVGVYLHGAAGDLAAAETGDAGVLAREIADRLPLARARLLEQAEHETSPAPVVSIV